MIDQSIHLRPLPTRPYVADTIKGHFILQTCEPSGQICFRPSLCVAKDGNDKINFMTEELMTSLSEET